MSWHNCGESDCVFCSSPLKRMTVGMLFAAMAFVAAALVQIEIDVSVKRVNQIQMFTFRKTFQAPQI